MSFLHLSLIIYFIFIFAWVIITYKFGDWRNWRIYYPTILFFWCGNLIGFEVLHDELLWEFKSKALTHVSTDLIQMLFIFTCTTILFLQYYPKKMRNQVLYILLWTMIYSVIESVFHLFGSIVYHHGWSLWWSAGHNIYQFILLRIHYKRPIAAWVLAIMILAVTMVIFDISL